MSNACFKNESGIPGSPDIQFLEGNDGIIVGPDPITHVINVVGNNTANNGFASYVTGNAGTYTETIHSYGTAKWVVNPIAGVGTHQTISAALTSASSGDTIFVTPGTYTENPTGKAGVDIVAYGADPFNPNVILNGKLTCTFAGAMSISGINFTNTGDYSLVVSGSAATVVTLNDCVANPNDNTFLNFSSSSSSASVTFIDCHGDLPNTGIAYFAFTSPGTLSIEYCNFINSAGATTANTCTAGQLSIKFSTFRSPITYSSPNTISTFNQCSFNTTANNTTFLTMTGLGTVIIIEGNIQCGTASCVSVGAGTTLSIWGMRLQSSNTNVITGAGTMVYGALVFSGSSYAMNVTSMTGAFLPVDNGTSGQVWTSTGANSVATFQSLPSGGITTINGDTGSITGPIVKIFADNPIAGASVRFVNSGTISQLQTTDTLGNTFVGQNAGKTTVSGGGNTAFGQEPLFNITSGSGNNCFGGASGFNLTTGSDNCFFGEGVCENLISGSGNIVIGSDLEGQNYTSSESNNILISNRGVTAESNVMRLGTTGSGTGEVNQCFIAGAFGVTVTGSALLMNSSGQIGTIASSFRYKENIQNINSDVSVLHLRPVEFNYKSDPSNSKQYGLIAEEVAIAFPYLCVYNAEGKPDAVKYHELPVLLLKEIQSLKKEIELLKSKISC